MYVYTSNLVDLFDMCLHKQLSSLNSVVLHFRGQIFKHGDSRNILIELLLLCNKFYLELMMMNCFCRMVDRQQAFSLMSSRNHCQRFSPSQISDTPRAGFKFVQNLSSGFVEWICVVVITATPQHHHGIYELVFCLR